MKKILIISYVFPPIAGAGVQRPLKLAKYLHDFDIEPIIFCPENAVSHVNDPKLLDHDFLKKIKIYRKGIKNLGNYYHLRFKKRFSKHPHYYFLGLKYIWFMDFFSSWFFECRDEVLKIVKREKANCVFTTSPPNSVHLFGNYLKNNGIPWIMDIRDSISYNPDKRKNYKLKEMLNLHYEKKFCSSADAIVAVSDPILESLKRKHEMLNLRPKMSMIPNGFDPEDYQNLEKQRKANYRQHMVITYTGSFMGKRTPAYFLEGLSILIKKRLISKEDILLQLVGDYGDDIKSLIDKYSKLFPIKTTGFVSYEKAVMYQVNADILLLIVSNDSRESSQTITGKFFEYVGAKVNIFASIPDGPLKDTIIKGGFGFTSSPTESKIIASDFYDVFKLWKKNKLPVQKDNNRFRESFSRKSQAKQLADIIHQL